MARSALTLVALVCFWSLLPGSAAADAPPEAHVLIAGVLAPARPGLLYEVEARRAADGLGFSGRAEQGTILLAVSECRFLGAYGWVGVQGVGWFSARVVDCQQATHRAVSPLHTLGIAADFDGPPGIVSRLAHQPALILLPTSIPEGD